jgi:aspartate/methionine/tyrosine aminotransferase
MRLSRRAQKIPASVTLDLDARVKAQVASGVDVISMAAGQPDFPGPPEAAAAAREWLVGCGGRVGYTPSSGIPELREAAARQLNEVSGTAFEAGQVVVTCGATEALILALLALVEAGDEVLMPSPYWLSYEPMTTITAATVVTVAADPNTHKLKPEALAAAITDKTRVLLLNSPSNPTGAVYTRDELLALANVLADHQDITVISDEIYWPFVFEGEFASPASIPGLEDRVVVVNGASKAYAMTGWRVGWVGGPAPVIKAIGNLKSHMTSNISAPAQYAALAALEHGAPHIAAMKEAFARRRNLALAGLADMKGVSCAPPAGAFYLFPRMDAFYEDGGAITGSVDFCGALLDDARVAAVPGAAFGEDRCIRLSIAASDEQITEALARLSGFLGTLNPSTVESHA